jgi:hypothetical protein
LEFIQKFGGINLMEYDRMVDSLCGKNISVLGLVDNQLLIRHDYNDPIYAEGYRIDFSSNVANLADYFVNRINYWEIWNEPDNAIVDPGLYAPLVRDTYNAIKAVNPSAHAFLGGPGSAWRSTQGLVSSFYDEFDNLGQIRPEDGLTVHPYSGRESPSGPTYGPDPAYLTDPGQMDVVLGDNDILDKFYRTMTDSGDGGKKIWITEIGWNSAAGHPDVQCNAEFMVTLSQQASYLKRSFDILLANSYIEKMFWYQYMDGRNDRACLPPGASAFSLKGQPAQGITWDTLTEAANAQPWLYGLYEANVDRTAKPVQCAFQNYPLACHFDIYLPLLGQ